MPPREDQHINLRKYIDITDPKVSSWVEKILQSPSFQSIASKQIGRSWKVSSVMIWRNTSDNFTESEKEINSSHYHLDNGNMGLDRNVLNIFMYLSDVNENSGPFTFYNINQSKLITRKYFSEILKNGDLRRGNLVKDIEELISPKILITKPGEALIINNQLCLHRAGYCIQGHRDILEICIRPSNFFTNVYHLINLQLHLI